MFAKFTSSERGSSEARPLSVKARTFSKGEAHTGPQFRVAKVTFRRGTQPFLVRSLRRKSSLTFLRTPRWATGRGKVWREGDDDNGNVDITHPPEPVFFKRSALTFSFYCHRSKSFTQAQTLFLSPPYLSLSLCLTISHLCVLSCTLLRTMPWLFLSRVLLLSPLCFFSLSFRKRSLCPRFWLDREKANRKTFGNILQCFIFSLCLIQ